MKLFEKFKKEEEPIFHKGENNLEIKEGRHFFENCEDIVLTGKAIALETTNSTFKEVSGKAKIYVFNSGKIKTLSGKAVVGLFKEGEITNVLLSV